MTGALSLSAQRQANQVHISDLIPRLERLLDQRTEILEANEQSIDSLKQLLPSADSSQQRDLLREIARRYTLLQADSSMTYARRMMATGDTVAINSGLLTMARVLPLQGRDLEAGQMFLRIDTAQLTRQQLVDYHLVGESLCRHFYPTVDSVTFDYDWKQHTLALINLLPDKDPLRYRSVAIDAAGKDALGVETANLMNIFYSPKSIPQLKVDAALLTAQLCERENLKGSDEEYNYLLQAAIGELEFGITTYLALSKLGIFLNERGDNALALRVMNAALANGVYSSTVLASETLAPYADFILNSTERKTQFFRQLFWMATAVCIFAIGLIIWNIILIRRKRRQIRELLPNRMTARQRTFTVDYLNLYAIINEKYEEKLRTMKRKLAAGQTDEVNRLLKSGRLLDERTDLFNETFDRTTLAMFPDFVERVNTLLLPDKQIVTPEAGQLTPELRIIALARLGIDETAAIARFLGLSNNTIYTYRNRLRSRAINRETLMAAVKAL